MKKAGKTDLENFEKDVLNSENVVLVDFWAEWCGPCRALAPVLDELANEIGDKSVIFKINVDSNPELAQKYGVRGIPTLLFFKNGKIEKTLVGSQRKETLKEEIDKLGN